MFASLNKHSPSNTSRTDDDDQRRRPDSPARFAVVGCRDCGGLWVVEHLHRHETATCRSCSRTHQTSKLRALARADDHGAICELRARILADRAGAGDAYDQEDDFPVLEERADEYLAQGDMLWSERADDVLGTIGAPDVDDDVGTAPIGTEHFAEYVELPGPTRDERADEYLEGLFGEWDGEGDGSIAVARPGEQTTLATTALSVGPRAS
ncbi:DUF5817 domain-containing protein, partial [Halobium palmae]